MSETYLISETFSTSSFIILHGSPIFSFHLLLIRWKMKYSPFHIISLLFRVWLILSRDGEHEEWLENSCKFSLSIVSKARISYCLVFRFLWLWFWCLTFIYIYIYYLFLKFNENFRTINSFALLTERFLWQYFEWI